MSSANVLSWLILRVILFQTKICNKQFKATAQTNILKYMLLLYHKKNSTKVITEIQN